METTSRMKMICNPFQKKIEYKWYDSNIGDYIEFDPETSELAQKEYINTTIQSRSYEIVDIINKECNVGNVGLDLEFIGTDDDYVDLCKVINTYYGDKSINCIKNKLYFDSARDVMKHIKEKFSDIKSMLEEYTEDEIAKLVDRYNDTIKPSISLCVVGVYSSGKSSFINSIIGEELLPSGSDPITAKVFKIYCDKKYQIRFLYDEKECVLCFEENKYKPNYNGDKEIIKDIQCIVNSGEYNNEISYMNKALKKLNSYKSESHTISDVIEIRLPFKHTKLPVNEFEFVIYDTPGSNSDSNKNHFDVLKNSLDEQTNALPILLTVPDYMDAEDNEKLLKLVEGARESLDTTNAIVIVNKSDEKGKKTLEEKKEKALDKQRSGEDLRIMKWKSRSIFFLSSIMGIASKKENPDNPDEWFDEDMYEIYEKNVLQYEFDKRKLFTYNIVDRSKALENDSYEDNTKKNHLYKNSGLEAVEREIAEYAGKYALYNKCQLASGYLQTAIEKCVENVGEAKEKRDEKLREVRKEFDTKKQELCSKLDEKKRDMTLYNAKFQKCMEIIYSEYIKTNNLSEDKESKKKQLGLLKNEWKEIKEKEKADKQDKKWTLDMIDVYVNDKLNGLLRGFSNSANKYVFNFWRQTSKEFKNNCRKVISDSDALTQEQKEIMDSVLWRSDYMSLGYVEFDLRKVGVIRKKRLYFRKSNAETFDIKKCYKELIKCFNNEVRTSITAAEKKNADNFKMWVDELINALTEKLCEFNSGLNNYKEEIDRLTKELLIKKECEKMLIESKVYIDNLLGMQGGDSVD